MLIPLFRQERWQQQASKKIETKPENFKKDCRTDQIIQITTNLLLRGVLGVGMGFLIGFGRFFVVVFLKVFFGIRPIWDSEVQLKCDKVESMLAHQLKPQPSNSPST